MKNIILLQKMDDGTIECTQISDKGIQYVDDPDNKDEGFWDEGGTITFEEIEEILNKER